jgi:hypothetical protein
MKFTVSFITNVFQETYICENAAIISSVLKENVSKLEFEITDLQTDLSLKTRVNDTNFWSVATSEQYPILKMSVVKVECIFRF